MMLNTSYRIVQNREDAEDIMQEAFLKAFQKMHQLKDSVSLGGWLKRIAVNMSLDKVRKKKKELWIEEVSKDISSEAEEELEITPAMSVDDVKKAINRLKEKYRIVLILYLLEGYNLREIAALLKLKESTVRNQFSRGKRNLVLELNKHQHEIREVHKRA